MSFTRVLRLCATMIFIFTMVFPTSIVAYAEEGDSTETPETEETIVEVDEAGSHEEDSSGQSTEAEPDAQVLDPDPVEEEPAVEEEPDVEESAEEMSEPEETENSSLDNPVEEDANAEEVEAPPEEEAVEDGEPAAGEDPVDEVEVGEEGDEIVDESDENIAAAAEEDDDLVGEEAADTEPDVEVITEPETEVSDVDEFDESEEAGETVDGESLADIAVTMSENDMVLVDENGDIEPLVTVDAAEALSSPDPWFEDPADATQVIAYQSDCTGWSAPAGYAGGVCNVSATPVQDAINNAVAGATVNVESGTFQEQVVINKNLTLQGIGNPVIQAPATPDSFKIAESGSTWQPIIFAYGGTDDGSGNISGAGTINVNIYGLTIDGNDRTPTGRSVGIFYRNADGEIAGNTVQNMNIDGRETFGILAYGDSEVNINNNTVSGYARGGIGANGDLGAQPDPDVTISNNTVIGPGKDEDVTWAPNGIQIGWGATGEITGNNVSGNGWPGPEWSGSGIIVAGSPNVEVKNNTITDNETGVSSVGDLWFGSGLTTDGMQIEGNTISNNTYGISLQDGTHNTSITGNVVSNNETDGIDVVNFGIDVPTGTVVNNNTITGNGVDGLWVDAGVPEVDAQNNWWGAVDGPGGDGPGSGDTVVGNADFTPWSTNATHTANSDNDPDRDGIANANDVCPNDPTNDVDGDGICGGVDACPNDPLNDQDGDGVCGDIDNCPGLFNPDQVDGNNNSVGDACEGGGAPAGPPPGAAPSPLSIPIPVTGGEAIILGGVETTLQLPNGNGVMFSAGAGTSASIVDILEDALPDDLPSGANFVAGISAAVFNGVAPVQSLPAGETLTVTFDIPAGMEGETFAILYWDATLNGGLGGWAEAGGEVVDGQVVVTVNFTGTFVLVTQ